MTKEEKKDKLIQKANERKNSKEMWISHRNEGFQVISPPARTDNIYFLSFWQSKIAAGKTMVEFNN